MKITVYGGTNNKSYSEQEMADCEKLGQYLASLGADILTGACGGFPYFVGRAAARAGGKVIGYTPALNAKEHTDVYKFPMDGVTDMVYAKARNQTRSEDFAQRSIDMTPFSDVVIAVGGSWGTFFELMLSFMYKKTIILIENYEGAVKAFSDVYDYFASRDVNPAVHFGPKIVKVKDIGAAIKWFAKNEILP